MLEASPSPEVRRVAQYKPFKKFLCKAIMCSRVINWIGREWGGMSPRSKCSVMDTANVPQDHKGWGASR